MKIRPFLSTLLCLTACTFLSGGCQRGKSFTVKVEGLRIPREHAAWLEVTNWNGDVQVVASDRFSQPEVRARVRALAESAPEDFEDLRSAVAVRATSSEENGRRVIRVTGASKAGPTAPLAIDLQVRVPRVWGLRVMNSGGAVEAVGVAGPINIQNGGPGKSAGDIDIRTSQPIKDEVTLFTSKGRVNYQVGPGSSGRIEITSTEGMPYVEAKVGKLNGIAYEGTRWRGVLDDGRNAVSILTQSGDARMVVIENAGDYGKEYWDGWPQWPTSPRWIAKLGGE